jgi:hypothetical protein
MSTYCHHRWRLLGLEDLHKFEMDVRQRDLEDYEIGNMNFRPLPGSEYPQASAGTQLSTTAI